MIVLSSLFVGSSATQATVVNSCLHLHEWFVDSDAWTAASSVAMTGVLSWRRLANGRFHPERTWLCKVFSMLSNAAILLAEIVAESLDVSP